MDKKDNLLELLAIYQDIVEKQDEMINQLGKVIARQATDLQLLKNESEFSDNKLEESMVTIENSMKQYNTMKNKWES